VLVELKARVRPAAFAVCVGLSQSKENAVSEVRVRQVFMMRRMLGLERDGVVKVKGLRQGGFRVASLMDWEAAG
jgi:hypothetical protein